MTVLGYGIDFGTTNSSISIAYDDHVEVVEIDPGAGELRYSLPSLSYLHREGTRAAGARAAETFMVTGSQRTRCNHCSLVQWDAEGGFSDCRQFQRDGGCVDSRLISGLKDEFANTSFTTTHSWALDFSLSDLAGVVMADLKQRADRAVGRAVERVVLGHPIAFVGAEGDEFESRQDLALDRLYETAEHVGFRDIELMPEPGAAVLDEQLPNGISLSLDFGGGTFDVAVIDVSDGAGETIALRGTAVGGSMFDAMLFDHAVHDELGLHRPIGGNRRPVPRWFAHGLRNLRGMRDLLNNKETTGIVGELRSAYEREAALIDQILFNGQAHAFYRAIEDAKIGLSTVTATTIDFRPPEMRPLAIDVNRREFDQLIQDPLDRVDRQIDLALDDAGIDARDVQAVVRTGGSSRLGAFVERLESRFGSEKIRARDAYASVALGLGVVAQEEWS